MDSFVLQRSCALCGVVDDGPRNEVALPSGARAFYHLPGSADCRVADADPHPDVDEPVATSQLRHALTADPNSPTPAPTDWLTSHTVDCQSGETGSLSVPPTDLEV